MDAKLLRSTSICLSSACALVMMLSLTQTGLSQAILQEQGGCPTLTDSDYCQMYKLNNPCADVPMKCFDYLHYFQNNLTCTKFPEHSVTTAQSLGTNGRGWPQCKSGSIPGSTCSNMETVCGSIATFWSANCAQADFCGNVEMEACAGTTSVNCPGNPL